MIPMSWEVQKFLGNILRNYYAYYLNPLITCCMEDIWRIEGLLHMAFAGDFWHRHDGWLLNFITDLRSRPTSTPRTEPVRARPLRGASAPSAPERTDSVCQDPPNYRKALNNPDVYKKPDRPKLSNRTPNQSPRYVHVCLGIT